jgi:uncharacterized membrane protein YedE/YeeE
MEHFTPLSASIGGALIGLSAAILWLGNGRIAGISGIFGQLLPPQSAVVWRLTFLVFLVLGTFVASYLIPGLGVGGPAGRPAALVTAPSWFSPGTIVWVAASGVLTGFGTKIGNGCTSGHGIVGLARLSKRSFAAVAVFFVVAIGVVTLTGVV